MNQPRLTLVRHEAAFKQNGRMLYTGKHAETRALDTTIKGLCAQPSQDRPVHRGGQSDICRIMLITSALSVIRSDGVPAIVRNPGRRERECFNAASLTAARIEMNADE